MTSSPHKLDNQRETALTKALAFFDRNPDEMQTREDICVKFECCPRTAKTVARALLRAGVSRAQLPRNQKPTRDRRRVTRPFPENLTESEQRAVLGVHRFGSIDAAAAAYELRRTTIESQLRDARRKAGVRKTADLVAAYLRATSAEEASS